MLIVSGTINRQCHCPRGRGVGGTTLINGLIYSRGNPRDYDNWAAMGNAGWSYNDVLPYFRRSENFGMGDPGYHGIGGEWNVEFHQPLFQTQVDLFLRANRERGVQLLDYNGRQQLGVSLTQLNTLNGTRHDNAKAFLRPVLHRKNLIVITESYVTKILIHDFTKTAYGVTFMHNRRKYVARASREVILSGGTINSPHLLLLSGIGPTEVLQQFKIKQYANLPVGRNFFDHPTFYGMTYTMNYTEQPQTTQEYVRQYLNGAGAYAYPGGNAAIGYYQTIYAKIPGYPDIELMFIPSNLTDTLTQREYYFTNETYQNLWGRLDTTRHFKLYVVLMSPVSRGTVTLQSANPYVYPLIDYNMLSDLEGYDIARLYEGVKIVLDLFNTNVSREAGVKFVPPTLPACRKYLLYSKKYWYCTIRQLTLHLYHPAGTNKMGPNPQDSVVDPNLKVHGINNLRVIDTSVFPTPVIGHTCPGTVMIAEKGSDIIKQFYNSQYYTGNGIFDT